MKKHTLFSLIILLVSCVEDINHKTIDTTIVNPDISQKTEITFKQLYNLHNNEIGKDTIVTGYVVSSDQQGNFYKEIFVQNTLGIADLGVDNPRMGMRIRVGLTNTSTKYAKGRKVIINLEGLKRTTSDDLITLGKPSGTYIKDILEFELGDYILKTDEVGIVIPKILKLSDLTNHDLNTLVKIEDLHFNINQIGMPFSSLPTDEYDGLRILEFCNTKRRDTILLETSNFADFSDNLIPNAQVDITAIYNISFNNEPILVLNQIEDLVEIGTYDNCPEIVTPNIMITEVADPKEVTKARFVEIYNPTNKEVSLKDWILVRYNYTSFKNTKELAALPISLTNVTIPAKGFVIVTRDKAAFSTYFEVTADIESSNLDGNGDDAYELLDPFGALIDVYGNASNDGTGSDWEYMDGIAVRKVEIDEPNSDFIKSEWEILNVNIDIKIKLKYNPRKRWIEE
ncbi:DUF5689 domain-containing protein [Wenyingzhuangia marina]|uniref:Lamin Tail Domain n=1 Tax=Wenyingzhuangia marina TaxID=1195760 RepID=A0A1M5S9Z7_9FLAO|nr:DUF5689 domain-containing protein [Wenyingzhuangia marina]GGF61349.1 hypothetical protein GCM10011397_00550 [Wenyingzhuangia marina]SHH35108.1 Lamin Tail Domain [Wenyingzhuangia marina]